MQGNGKPDTLIRYLGILFLIRAAKSLSGE